MDEVDLSDPDLVEAVRLWTGWRSAPFPQSNEESVTNRFGRTRAISLMRRVHAAYEAFYESDARLWAPTATMGDLAAIEFMTKYPGADRQLVSALAWSYSFDYK